MAEVLLETKALSFAYGEEGRNRPALEDINLKVLQGEYVAIIGPSGSGKTTLLKHFNALLTPCRGQVLVKGLSTAEKANHPEIRRLCGMIFQNPDNQLVANTVEEDVAFGLENYRVPPAEIRSRVAELLKQMELEDLARRPPHLLSGGQKQRVAIAGILAMRPRCLLMDEPTSMLDPRGRRELLETVQKLNREQGITVLHVTHYPEEAALARRVLVLEGGRLAADGPPREILTDLALLHSLGLRGTAAAEMAAFLREADLPLPPKLLGQDELVEQICSLLPAI